MWGELRLPSLLLSDSWRDTEPVCVPPLSAGPTCLPSLPSSPGPTARGPHHCPRLPGPAALVASSSGRAGPTRAQCVPAMPAWQDVPSSPGGVWARLSSWWRCSSLAFRTHPRKPLHGLGPWVLPTRAFLPWACAPGTRGVFGSARLGSAGGALSFPRLQTLESSESSFLAHVTFGVSSQRRDLRPGLVNERSQGFSDSGSHPQVWVCPAPRLPSAPRKDPSLEGGDLSLVSRPSELKEAFAQMGRQALKGMVTSPYSEWQPQGWIFLLLLGPVSCSPGSPEWKPRLVGQ